MKNTLAIVALFVFLTLSFSNDALAFLPPIDDIRDNIKIVLPTATPKPTLKFEINPNIDFKLISTVTPTTKLTITPSPTPETKITVTPEPTLGTKVTSTLTREETQEISPSVEATKTEENTENKVDLKTWFMGITMGLLALIIIIQLFPKKKADQ